MDEGDVMIPAFPGASFDAPAQFAGVSYLIGAVTFNFTPFDDLLLDEEIDLDT